MLSCGQAWSLVWYRKPFVGIFHGGSSQVNREETRRIRSFGSLVLIKSEIIWGREWLPFDSPVQNFHTVICASIRAAPASAGGQIRANLYPPACLRGRIFPPHLPHRLQAC